MEYLPPQPLAEGKTKIIYEHNGCPGEVLVVSKDTITAGNGVKKDVIPGKGIDSTETTTNVFKLLKNKGVPTHFMERNSPSGFIAQKVQMAPFEVVVRGMCAGSYAERQREVSRGLPLNFPAVEFYKKDDELGDPLTIFDFDAGLISYHDAHKPLDSGVISTHQIAYKEPLAEEISKMSQLALESYKILRQAWRRQCFELADVKFECGYTEDNGELVIADVVDNDSWRLWINGNPNRPIDKDLYRKNLVDLDGVAAAYREVAYMSKNLIE